ncbi:MAG TPA: pilus assembly protein PilQ, partial [Gammaproteobacteria bacterium]|nr:pilus assembly protein PilQ [Gammaproteobacteria bacterium]
DSSKQVKITIDDRLNSLIIQATKSELDLISRLIKEVDVRTKQILIEAFIVEATDEFTKNLGARLGMDATNLSRHGGHPYDVQASGLAGGASNVVLGGASGSLSNLAVANPTAGIGFIFNSTSSALKIELTAAQLEEKTQLISNPRVFTLDNEQAVIIEGEEIPYEVPNEEGGVEIEMKEAGIKLTVTPSIIGDGNIILDVEIERKTVKGTSKNPPLLTRKITTKLLIKDKTIVVIGGVMTEDMTNTVKKVPFFGDLPFIGRLFRNDADKNKKKELLIFLAPRII